MSRENVELVQRFIEAVERLLETWDTFALASGCDEGGRYSSRSQGGSWLTPSAANPSKPCGCGSSPRRG
jgi:hypothetical protein